jgi:hypothetical protein
LSLNFSRSHGTVFMRHTLSFSSVFAVVKTCYAHNPRNYCRTITMASFKVHNTLKPGPPQAFVPIEEGKISWYVCGPTVYDHSHLGHARNYVSTDIIRRILMHFFGYKVKFVMNITDIDDKVKPIITISVILYGLEPSLTKLNRSYSRPDGRGFWSWRRRNLIPNHKSPSWVGKPSYSMQQAICRR